MNLSDLMLEKDFYRLNNDDISALIRVLKLNLEKSEEGKKYIYDNRDDFFKKSDETKKIILNKIFVGKTSVKWYKIRELDDENKNEILLNIEQLFYYNRVIDIDPKEIKNITCIGCFKLNDDKYIFRYLVPDREIKQDDGLNINKVKKIKNVITIIDFKNKFIEIRTDFRTSKKILDKVVSAIGLTDIEEHSILYKYGGNLETFRDSLQEGRFKNVKAAPKSHINLTEEDTLALIKTLKIIDSFFINRDYDKLVEALHKIDFETDGLDFTQIFLAGMAKIGMSIRKDSSEDMSLQPIYRMLETYVNNESGYISFQNPSDENFYTIQVGLTTNSIYFLSEGSESAIAYIRDKLL